jgi:hypothetical protein
LNFVSPTVKPGWKITVEKDAKGNPSAIVWAGNIPTGFRDDLGFSAQVPDKPVDLAWKAYQTYQGNQIVSWDLDPADPASKDREALEKTGKGPYSVTHVVDDLAGSDHAMTMAPQTPVAPAPPADSPASLIALLVALAALVIAVVALVRRKKS